jgi:O-antigen ligase
MLALAAPRAGVLAACLLLITATAAVRVVEEHQADLPFGIRRALSLVDTESLELRDLSHGRADQLIAWQTVFGEHPWLGVGPDQFRYSIPRLVLGGKAQEMHNTYLAVLAEAGLAGGVMIFVLLADALARAAAFLRRAVRRRGPEELALARALLVSYVCLLLYGTVNHGLRQRYLWLVIALIVSAPHVYRAAPGGTGAGAPRRIRLRPAAAIAPYVNARSTA